MNVTVTVTYPEGVPTGYFGTTGRLAWTYLEGVLTVLGRGEMKDTPWKNYMTIDPEKVVIEEGLRQCR